MDIKKLYQNVLSEQKQRNIEAIKNFAEFLAFYDKLKIQTNNYLSPEEKELAKICIDEIKRLCL